VQNAEYQCVSRDHQYKKRFKRWGWKKNDTVQNYAQPGSELTASLSHTGEQTRGTRSTSTCTLREEDDDSPRCDVERAQRPSDYVLEAPISIWQVENRKLLKSILSHVKKLYLGSITQEKWQVKNQFVVQEKIHDDLLVRVGMALNNFDSHESNIGWKVVKKAFRTLERVVDDCGLFSLPMIWESYRRMIRKGYHVLATMFLEQAIGLAICRASRESSHEFHCSFARVLYLIFVVQRDYPNVLEYVILLAYHECINYVLQELTSNHLTTLLLWSDFVVYMENSTASQIKQAVDNFRLVIKQAKIDNGVDGDFTLEILGLNLYVLQATDSTAAEAEQVASEMLDIVDRRVGNGEKLEGDLLITWKDLKHTLGNFCYARGELEAAVVHVEECLQDGVVDDRDIIALRRLEEWYDQRGERGKLDKVRERRICSSSKFSEQENDASAESGGSEENYADVGIERA
jgi:hypothetical protein